MSERGYIRFYRSTLTHPFFRDDAERMAWLRLLAAAAWKPYKKRAGEFLVELQRGEVVGAVRYLAAEWQWSRGKVERFLNRLKNEGMIETRTETGITVITVCKYNEFQSGEDDGGTPIVPEPRQGRDAAETGPRQGRDAVGDNKEEIKHSITVRSKEVEQLKDISFAEGGDEITDSFGDDGVALGQSCLSEQLLPMTIASATTIVPSPIKRKRKKRADILSADQRASFNQWYAAYPRHESVGAAEKAYASALKDGDASVECLLAGARQYAFEKRNTETKFIKLPASWLNGKCWLDEPARRHQTIDENSATAGILSFFGDNNRDR